MCTVGDGCTLDGVAWTIPNDVFGVVWKELMLATLFVSHTSKGAGQKVLTMSMLLRTHQKAHDYNNYNLKVYQ